MTDRRVIPELAVSVIPVSEGQDDCLDVFVQHRARTMDFAAEVVVFPGGRVTPEDYSMSPDEQVQASVLDRHATAWAQTSIAAPGSERLREMCRVLMRCSRREVEEETGWRLEPGRLIPWANWVTPPDLPKRFDTYFFVARVDDRRCLSHQTTEADRSEWRSVQSLLTDYGARRLRMMRPTVELLESLAIRSDDLLQAGARAIVPRRPHRARPY